MQYLGSQLTYLSSYARLPVMERYTQDQEAGCSLDLAINSTAIMALTADQEREHQMMSSGVTQATRYLNQRDRILMYQINQYHLTKATARSKAIAKSIHEVVKVVHDVLRELEIQEPRFISTFTEVNGHYEGELLSYRTNHSYIALSPTMLC